MHVRVVRFTDVVPDRIEEIRRRVEEGEGPPPGVKATGLNVFHDPDQGTAVVLQFFGSREDMEAGAETFAAMDPSDTPGTRASVDMCEVKLDWKGS